MDIGSSTITSSGRRRVPSSDTVVTSIVSLRPRAIGATLPSVVGVRPVATRCHGDRSPGRVRCAEYRSPMQNNARIFGAEAVGTAVLVGGGVGTVVLAPGIDQVGVALAFGFSVLVMMYVIGPV